MAHAQFAFVIGVLPLEVGHLRASFTNFGSPAGAHVLFFLLYILL